MTESRVGVLSLLLLITVVLAACRAGSTAAAPALGERILQTQKGPVEGDGSYADVNAAVLTTMQETKDFLLINVHIPYQGEISGTDLFIPYNELEAKLEKLPSDTAAKLVVYCRSGSMSAIAARILVKLGYTDVWNLTAE